MVKEKKIITLVFLMIVSITESQYRKCVPQGNALGEIPSLPQNITHFHARYETILSKQKISVYTEEYFDYITNQLSVKQLVNGDEYFITVDFYESQLYIINMKAQNCSVQKITDNSILNAYLPVVDGKHINTFDKMFHMTVEDLEAFQGDVTVRNILVQHWDFCDIEKTEEKETTNIRISIFWADNSNNDWTFPANQTSFPVKIIMEGEKIDSKTNNIIPIFFEVNFFYWSTKPFNNPEVFQIPRGVICSDKVPTKPFPELPEQISFKVEVVIKSQNIHTNAWLWYDSPNVYRIDYYDYDNKKTMLTSEIYDFTTGLYYTYYRFALDPRCKISSIKTCEESLVNGRSINSIHQAFVAYERNFLGDRAPINSQFIYKGQRYENYILCDIWATIRSDWPAPNSGVITSWEWAFAVNETKGTQPQCKKTTTTNAYPVKVSIKVLSVKSFDKNAVIKPKEEIHFNFYDISLSALSPTTFDISPCYSSANKLRVEFEFQGQVTNTEISDIIDLLERKTYNSLVNTLKVNPLRIAQFRYVKDVDFKVKFTLLENSPILENVPVNFEESLMIVYSYLCRNLYQGKINFVLPKDIDETETFKISAAPYSLVINDIKGRRNCNEPPLYKKSLPKDTFYSSADLAGLAIGMIVVGLTLGSAGLHTYMTRKKKRQEMKKFSTPNMDVPSMIVEEAVEAGPSNQLESNA